MSVLCPVCGLLSQDGEFCDHCNTDLSPPAQVLPQRLPVMFGKGRLSAEQRRTLTRPEAWIEAAAKDGSRWRLHWLPAALVPGWLPLLEERARLHLNALPVCQRLDDPDGLWLAAASAGTPALPWLEARAEDPIDELRRLLRFAGPLAEALGELHRHQLVWLNFDPAELETETLAGQAKLIFRNLDLEVFPAATYPERLTLKPSMTAPEISQGLAEQIGPAADTFHLAIFCYYWLARKLPAGFAGAGLEAFDYRLPPLRIFAPDLPPGIVDTLTLGLAADPRRRLATPALFLAALNEAVERADQRARFSGKLSWEIGAHTRTGRAKTALGWDNEDRVLVKEFPEPPAALLAVADGITSCDVGTGAQASGMMMDVLQAAFEPGAFPPTQECFAETVAHACQRGAQALLDWAIQQGFETALRDGLDLMGTTLTAAWLQDHFLSLANLGDSRAYLVTANAIEQLTVDGDLGTTLLLRGTAPEQVRDLGGLSKALRECIGGCQLSYSGELVPLADCLPTLARCPLLPGDIVVVCSDGLIEERVFLDPRTVLELVNQHRGLPAAELTLHLVEAADALQRTPLETEPEGFGDNISCIVIKIGERGA